MSLLSQSTSPHPSCEILINKTGNAVWVDNKKRIKAYNGHCVQIILLVSQFLGNLNALQVVVKQKERKFPQVGLENFNEAHWVKSNPTISYN